jgi:hypothetical protein
LESDVVIALCVELTDLFINCVIIIREVMKGVCGREQGDGKCIKQRGDKWRGQKKKRTKERSK